MGASSGVLSSARRRRAPWRSRWPSSTFRARTIEVPQGCKARPGTPEEPTMRTMRAAVPAVLCLLAAVPACGGREGAAGVGRSSAPGTFPQDSVGLLVLEGRKNPALHRDTPRLKDVAALPHPPGRPLGDI